MDVSENSGTPKSSILIGFSIINHPFWGTTIFGNAHITWCWKNEDDRTVGHDSKWLTWQKVCWLFQCPKLVGQTRGTEAGQTPQKKWRDGHLKWNSWLVPVETYKRWVWCWHFACIGKTGLVHFCQTLRWIYGNLTSKPTTSFLLQFSHPWDFWSMNFTLYPPSHNLGSDWTWLHHRFGKTGNSDRFGENQQKIRWELSNPGNLRILPKSSFWSYLEFGSIYD